jgi:hypothetical protein
MLFYYHLRELLFEYLVFLHVMLRVFVLLLWCRSRTWLFLSYVIAFVSLAGSAGMLVQDALLPDTPSSWTGVAGVLQCTCVLARYTHLHLFSFPFLQISLRSFKSICRDDYQAGVYKVEEYRSWNKSSSQSRDSLLPFMNQRLCLTSLDFCLVFPHLESWRALNSKWEAFRAHFVLRWSCSSTPSWFSLFYVLFSC